uniref:Protein pelota homolog n=1 Tax=Spongospora subterranea TaxID=70186 RepID=A0A0H5RPR1_9EUKA|eukprot:CRZ10714.1 hypothetical protein [Spongospora subterranea]
MRILHRDMSPDGSGSIKVQADTGEDIWHLYNLVSVDDRVTGLSWRKVQNMTATGSTTTTKVKTSLTLAVVSVDYDASGQTLRISGKNVVESKYVKLGQFHTLEMVAQRSLTIYKSDWDQLYLDRLETACDPAASSEVAVVLMQPGLAHITLIGAHMTSLAARIETTIPKKRLASNTRHDKGVVRFFDQVLTTISNKIRFDIVKCVVIGSPGFLKDDFMLYLNDECVKRDMKHVLANVQKFVLISCSSAHLQSLKEILTDPSISALVEDTKAVAEVRALDQFYSMLNTQPDRAFYGPKHVRQAADENAIATLLITDDLFRAADPIQRKSYVSLVEQIKDGSGEVFIFSTQHPSGQQLSELTGIAAILRFPIHADSDDDQQSSSSDEDEK